MQRLRLMLSSLLRTLAWEPASQIILRDCCREIRDKTRYRGVFAGDKCSWTSKITANHKNRHIELMNLVFFYVWKDARVWAYWNFSFDMILSGLGPVFCFFSSILNDFTAAHPLVTEMAPAEYQRRSSNGYLFMDSKHLSTFEKSQDTVSCWTIKKAECQRIDAFELWC